MWTDASRACICALILIGDREGTMEKKFASRHGAVMTEPVIAIMFFAVISVFLLRIFAATEKIRSSAEKTSNAVIRAESVVEYALASKEDEKELKGLGFNKVTADGKTVLVKYYDNDWNEAETVGEYAITVTVDDEETGNGRLINYTIRVSEINLAEKSGEVFTLKAKKYESGGGAE